MPRVLVCAATRAELEACTRGLRAAGRGGREPLGTGVGPGRAAQALAERLARGALPDLVVSSGFAGTLSASIRPGAWITAARLGEWDGMVRIPVEGVSLAAGPRGLVRCDVLSSRQLIPAETSLGKGMTTTAGRTPVVVDMESAALAREAGRRGVAFAVVRLISDTPSHPLPAFVSPLAAALAATTTASRLTLAGRGLRAAARDPRGVIRLVRDSGWWLRALEDGWRELAWWPEG